MESSLPKAEQEALLALCLMAAFADGSKGDAERERIRQLSESLVDPGVDVPAVYRDVLLRRLTPETAAARLAGKPSAALAYEMAVGVCEADDATSPAERAFLDQLRPLLGLSAASAGAAETAATQVALAPVAVAAAAAAGAPPPSPAARAAGPDTQTDGMILNYSILNGALELLPESLATMAILPLQMKMVYRIGKRHGYELDRGHIKEFLATAGLGLTSQVVEGFARKLLKGVLGKGMVGSLAGQAVSSGFSFASTYALGKVAQSYYAGGRQLGAIQLRALFDQTLAQAKGLHAQHLPSIREKASSLDLPRLLQEVRSGGGPA
ncbi:MAG: DUF533 domain-containing protein [Opitutia bacterium]